MPGLRLATGMLSNDGLSANIIPMSNPKPIPSRLLTPMEPMDATWPFV
jgi:hypothetical protein